MDGRNFNRRCIIFLAIIGLLLILCVIRLFNLQVVKGEEYRNQAEMRLVRAYPVKAPRGELVDRYGEPFVQNKMGYTVQIQAIDMDDDKLHEEILGVSKILEKFDNNIEADFPIFYSDKDKEWKFTYTQGDNLTDEEVAEREEKLKKWKEENKVEEYETAQSIIDYYQNRFKIAGKYNEKELEKIISVRYDMSKSGFSAKNPYIMARDIDAEAVQIIKEKSMDFPGIEVEIEPVRVFAQGTMAAHVLGRTDKIYAEEYQELKEKGYGINDIIGKDGLEKVLEPYLKGKDGYKSVSMSRDSGTTEIIESQEAKPGNYAKLTLDMELQRAAEKALKESVTQAVDSEGAGGAIAIIPSTGEVLALASYPSYNPATFVEDYEKLEKVKGKPLINHVLNGIYSPGSTFKPLTAIAGLETGVIKPDTYIVDKGKYTYFDSYQPTCLVYSSKGETHGTIEVSEALGVSCNYFFYEVGRLVGIDKLVDYAEKFGLGDVTGIELAESKGLVANPKHREELGEEWYPGDVIQAAIGQSDNLFTPAQLANYFATILNKGKRYKLHLVNEIVDYDTGEAVKKNSPELLSETKISSTTLEKVKAGLRRVVTSGTAKDAFADSKYKAAGKTGTAEVPNGADNVLFVGFAPYDNPEIVVAVVIEHGANSHYAARVARKIFDAYMELKEKRENPNKKSETEETQGQNPGQVAEVSGDGVNLGDAF